MRAGLLTDTITLQRKTIHRDAYGASTTAWTNVWAGRANVQFARGSRKEVNGEIINAVERKIVLRQQAGAELGMRVAYNGQYYRIITLDHRRTDMSTILMCELINE